MRRLFGRAADVAYPPLSGAEADRLTALAHDVSIPPRLRLAAALVVLPPLSAIEPLAEIATDPTVRIWTRARAATRLTEIDPARGLAAQREIVRDRRVWRPIRWAVLWSSDVLELSEFALQRGRLDAIDTDSFSGLLKWLRLSLTDPS
jgi:hypothetical protein